AVNRPAPSSQIVIIARTNRRAIGVPAGTDEVLCRPRFSGNQQRANRERHYGNPAHKGPPITCVDYTPAKRNATRTHLAFFGWDRLHTTDHPPLMASPIEAVDCTRGACRTNLPIVESTSHRDSPNGVPGSAATGASRLASFRPRPGARPQPENRLFLRRARYPVHRP